MRFIVLSPALAYTEEGLLDPGLTGSGFDNPEPRVDEFLQKSVLGGITEGCAERRFLLFFVWPPQRRKRRAEAENQWCVERV
jgi:hypothetical protein